MTTAPTRFFTIAFSMITLLEMASDTLRIHWLHYGSKPLIMVLLFLYVWQQYRTVNVPKAVQWLLVGIVFALLGDVFLMIREVNLFALGLGSFLIMQLCYSRVFWLSIRQLGQPVSIKSLWKPAIPFLIYDALFLTVLYPVFSNTPVFTPLWWPVVGYVLCLSTMGLLATQTGTVQLSALRGKGSVLIGALLFILSDSAIAVDKFLQPIPGATWVVMSTYAAAQYLIVVGIVSRNLLIRNQVNR